MLAFQLCTHSPAILASRPLQIFFKYLHFQTDLCKYRSFFSKFLTKVVLCLWATKYKTRLRECTVQSSGSGNRAQRRWSPGQQKKNSDLERFRNLCFKDPESTLTSNAVCSCLNLQTTFPASFSVSLIFRQSKQLVINPSRHIVLLFLKVKPLFKKWLIFCLQSFRKKNVFF